MNRLFTATVTSLAALAFVSLGSAWAQPDKGAPTDKPAGKPAAKNDKAPAPDAAKNDKTPAPGAGDPEAPAAAGDDKAADPAAGADGAEPPVPDEEKKPSIEDLEKAKVVYLEGKALFDAKSFKEAVPKFKEAYKLSRNPLLLYNIGFTLDELKEADNALFYYEKFLADASPDAAVYKEVEGRVRALKRAKELNEVFDSGSLQTEEPVEGRVTEFMHKVVEETPPGVPLDITAFIPEASGWQVTLFYRAAGEDKFESTLMRKRYNEMVGRIPAAKTGAKTLQYYIVVRDKAGNIITRSGRAASPNLVFVEPKAQPKYYPDLNTEGDFDPSLQPGYTGPDGTDGTAPAGSGFVDSSTYRGVKWGATIATVAFLGTYIAFYSAAASEAESLQLDAEASVDGDQCEPRPACRQYSQFQKDREERGQRFQTWARVSFGAGLLTAAVAGAAWGYELYTRVEERPNAATPAVQSQARVTTVPVVGRDFIGGAALLRF